MLKYIGQRFCLMIITLFIIIAFTFFIVHAAPGSAFSDPSIRPEVRAVLSAKYHLDEPVIVQFGYYLKNLINFDFGVSMTVQPQVSVMDIIKQRMPITIILNLLSILVILPVSFLLGIVSALKKNTIIDHIISVLVVITISVPSFVFAALLQYCFAFKLGWFPILLSNVNRFDANLLHSMVLPVLAMSFGSIATITRYLRAELSEALNSDYMLLAKTKGLSQGQAVVRHAIRNSLIPVVGIILGMFFGLLSGSMVIENIFSIPGLGGLSIQAINASDYTLVMGTTIVYSLIGVLGRLAIDLSYGIIDPRIRIGGGKDANG